jgi:threonine dehydratase
MQPPTLQDVFRARQVINRYLAPTPLVPSTAMSEVLGCDVSLKLETAQPLGAFKVRGGISLAPTAAGSGGLAPLVGVP